jgi:hypothetical protein
MLQFDGGLEGFANGGHAAHGELREKFRLEEDHGSGR